MAEAVQLRVMQTRADRLILTQVISGCHMQSCIKSIRVGWWEQKLSRRIACTAIWIAAKKRNGCNPFLLQLASQIATGLSRWGALGAAGQEVSGGEHASGQSCSAWRLQVRCRVRRLSVAASRRAGRRDKRVVWRCRAMHALAALLPARVKQIRVLGIMPRPLCRNTLVEGAW